MKDKEQMRREDIIQIITQKKWTDSGVINYIYPADALEVLKLERERTLNEVIEEFTFAKNVQKYKHPESHIQIIDIDTVIEILTKLKEGK